MPAFRLVRVVGLLAAVAAGCASSRVLADTVTLKSGVVYRGTVDRDNTIVFVFDGLKRVIFRDSKIAQVEADASYKNLENFKLVQPLEVHGLDMPSFAMGIQAGPWDEFGRRTFRYVGPKGGKPVTMKQAIIELGPHLVTLRGVDGSWRSQLITSQVPKNVVLAILAKVDQKNQNERKRVVRFLIQAEWYDEALKELDRLQKDFPGPELKDQLEVVKQSIQQLQAELAWSEAALARKAQQPKGETSKLKNFPTDGVGTDLLVKVREQLRQIEGEQVADKQLADSVGSLAERLPEDQRKAWKAATVEILAACAEAPEAVRGRLAALQKSDPADPADNRFALVVTGWILGSDAATNRLETAEALWKARGLIEEYLRSPSEDSREQALSALQGIEWTDRSGQARKVDLDTATRLAKLMLPPLHNEKTVPGEPKIFQVLNDGNEVPTEYTVLLPPEYSPWRSYPAVVALHSGLGDTAAERMRHAVDWWATEAARHGYIVVAPEYNLPDQPADYRYTPDEHAAVELALRDARKRFSIDSDRVFLGGVLIGGNMAWDYGLAHPDMFAGVAVVSGLPAKYAERYWNHAENVPMYIAMGDLAPGTTDIVFPLVKAMLNKVYDVTYSEYYRRGLEDLPEEAGPIFEWMDHRASREAYPKKFDVVTARTCDNRFYGVVIREFTSGRTTAPSAVEPLGKNLNPATIEVSSSSLSNLVKVNANGVRKIDVWVGPRTIDFKKRLEVRINGRAYFKGPVKPDLAPFLEDLRLRGDRQQIYWLKVSAG